MKKIEQIDIKPWDREKYPDFYTKTELQKMKLMPSPNAKYRARVLRPREYGGEYFLYDINKTVPYKKTLKQKKKEARARKLNAEKKKCELLKKQKLLELYEDFWPKFEQPEYKYETVVIDFETTGFDAITDEILQVAIIDQDGQQLINQLFRPIVLKEWPRAQAVHGITPGMVKHKPYFLDFVPTIAEILLSAKEVIAYNDSFEARFLSANGIPSTEISWGYDPMRMFARRYNDGRNTKLSKAAEALGYISFDAHDALEDVRATLFLYQKMKNEDNLFEEVTLYDCEDLAY